MARLERSSLDRRPGDRPNVGTGVRAHRLHEMRLATATGSVPRPRTIARPPPARRRPTRRARRERPVRGSARASGRRSSRCRTAGPAPLRVRDSPPSSPRRPGSHPTTASGGVQGELSVLFCARFSARARLTHRSKRPPTRGSSWRPCSKISRTVGRLLRCRLPARSRSPPGMERIGFAQAGRSSRPARTTGRRRRQRRRRPPKRSGL